MRAILIFWMAWFIAGCGLRSVPVSSATASTLSTDSTKSSSVSRLDSSAFRQSVRERTLPASKVSVGLTRSQMDSLYQALAAMPKSVNRSIYITDPKLQTSLALVLDSIGKLHIVASTAERKYVEITTVQDRTIRELRAELSSVKAQRDSSSVSVVKVEKSFLAKVKGFLSNIPLLICLVIIALGIVVWMVRGLPSIFRYLMSKIL